MFKSIILAAVSAGLATANFDNFPKIGQFTLFNHAEIKVTYPGRQCSDEFGHYHTILKGFGNEDPNRGTYAIKELNEPKTIWARRSDKYPYKETDDVGFRFTQNGDDCVVSGKSISQFLPHGQPHNAYCSIWNVMKYADTFIGLTNGFSSYTPTDPDHECVDYPDNDDTFLQ